MNRERWVGDVGGESERESIRRGEGERGGGEGWVV